jgi:diguanylate cyclase (GGDEF)-like protein
MSQPVDRPDRINAGLGLCGIVDAEGVDVFGRYAQMAATLVGTKMAAVSFMDGELWCKSVIGSQDHDSTACGPFCAQTMLADAPLLVNDAASDPRFADAPMVRGAPGLRFYLGAPLQLSGGERVGAVSAFTTIVRSAPPETIARLADLADAVTTTLELYRTMQEVKLLGLSDPLTGLPNTVHLFQALAAARDIAWDRYTPVSLLFIDCDDFERLNDTLGRPTGDQVLQALASMLQGGLTGTALAARLAGDSFAVMLPDSGVQEAGVVANQILQRGRDLMTARDWPTALSIGLVTFEVPPASVEIALALSEEAMCHAKSAGGDQVSLITIGAPFNPGMPGPADPQDP